MSILIDNYYVSSVIANLVSCNNYKSEIDNLISRFISLDFGDISEHDNTSNLESIVDNRVLDTLYASYNLHGDDILLIYKPSNKHLTIMFGYEY